MAQPNLPQSAVENRNPAATGGGVVGRRLSRSEAAEHIVNQMRGHKGIIETDTHVIKMNTPVIPLYNKETGELIGYELHVSLYDANGDVGVDSHRQFINPPDGRRKLDDGTIIQEVDTVSLVENALRQTVKP